MKNLNQTETLNTLQYSFGDIEIYIQGKVNFFDIFDNNQNKFNDVSVYTASVFAKGIGWRNILAWVYSDKVLLFGNLDPGVWNAKSGKVYLQEIVTKLVAYKKEIVSLRDIIHFVAVSQINCSSYSSSALLQVGGVNLGDFFKAFKIASWRDNYKYTIAINSAACLQDKNCSSEEDPEIAETIDEFLKVAEHYELIGGLDLSDHEESLRDILIRLAEYQVIDNIEVDIEDYNDIVVTLSDGETFATDDEFVLYEKLKDLVTGVDLYLDRVSELEDQVECLKVPAVKCQECRTEDQILLSLLENPKLRGLSIYQTVEGDWYWQLEEIQSTLRFSSVKEALLDYLKLAVR